MNIAENVFVCRIDVNHRPWVQTINTIPYNPEKFEQFVPEGQTLSGFEKFKVQEFILGLAEKKNVWTTPEIQDEAQEAGFGRSTVARAIGNLTQTGRLIRITRGEYEINR